MNKKGNAGHWIGLGIGLSIMGILFGLYLLTRDFWGRLFGALL